MRQRSSAPARALAATALVGGFLLLVIVVGASLDDGEENGRSGVPTVQTSKQVGEKKKPPKSYVVQNGDTLTSIARKTGVAVSRIEALNPGVDPQILVSGEKLKLR